MKAQTKSAVLLLATLVVGILVGALATSAIINNRVDEIRQLRGRGGMTGLLIDQVIQPTDDAQREKIEAILKQSEPGFEGARRQMFEAMEANRDSLRAELAAVLTPEQTARLNEFFDRGRGEFRRRRGPRGSGPPGPRGSR